MKHEASLGTNTGVTCNSCVRCTPPAAAGLIHQSDRGSPSAPPKTRRARRARRAPKPESQGQLLEQVASYVLKLEPALIVSAEWETRGPGAAELSLQ